MLDQIPFIDTHHHLWDLDRFAPSWLEESEPLENSLIDDYAPIRVPYQIEDLLLDFDGSSVVKSVHVQTGYAGLDPVDETQWLQNIADVHGFPHGIVAYTDLAAGSVEADLERHASFENLRGIRTFVQGEDLLEPAIVRGLAAMAHLDLTYDLSTTWEGMEGARKMADTNGNLRIILGHAGFPLARSTEYFKKWSGGMRLLAGAQNVTVKISGLGLADHSWSTDSIRPWVLEVIEVFGVDRCMFGTNWPVDKLFSSYQRLVDSYRSIIADFSLEEQEKLLWRNAEWRYRLT
ncbi:MAG: amidohydrolase family protein [Acidimicrobiia bacterium]|nr:amidohydrolase family protein [Acidimicrobiia bacterium]